MRQPPIHDRFFATACLFEASLIPAAWLLGWLVGVNPLQNLHWSWPAVGYGVAGTVPLFALLQGLHRLQHPSIGQIRQLLLRTLGAELERLRPIHLLALATIAGVAEELLFRGVLQPWLERLVDHPTALVASNLLFGLAHALTPLYFALATLVGCYFGLAMDYGGHRNLLTPIIIHTLYDFLAFIALLRAYRAGANGQG